MFYKPSLNFSAYSTAFINMVSLAENIIAYCASLKYIHLYRLQT